MKRSSAFISMALAAVLLAAGCTSNSGGGPTGVTQTASSAKAITAFSFSSPSVSGTISEATLSIAVTVPYGTNVTALVAVFTTTGASVRVGTATQTSGSTANNFTSPVLYTVTAADGTSVNYTVTVTVALPPAQTTKALLTFELAGVSGTINESLKTVTVVLPPDGTDLTALAATFTTSGTLVTVGTTTQVSSTTLNDFTHPVVYTVRALDGSTVSYTVSVSILTSPQLLSAFTVTSMPGIINQTTKAVTVTIPLQPVNALIATFVTTTGSIVKIGSAVQTSGITVNDFTNPVVYTVIGPDGTSVDYTVTVSIAPCSLLAFSFASVPAVGTIDHTTGSVALTVPARTTVASLVSTFSVTNTVSVDVGVAPQTSGVTVNDFTSPVVYTLTCASAVTKNYTVTATIAPGVLNLARTGQIASYSTTTTSDDGKLKKGIVWPNPRFTAVSSGTGTVLRDDLTGLEWANDGGMPAFTLCTAGTKTWQEALDYVACLNANSYLAHNDWRLPNVHELVSLVTSSQPDSHAWLNAAGFINMQGNFYHSSTTDAALTTQDRIVNMVTGNSVVGPKTASLAVVPVRGGTPSTARAPLPQTGQTTSYASGDDGALQIGVAWPSPRFTDPASTVLTASTSSLAVDQLTGLMWTKDGNTPNSTVCPMTGAWQAALDYIACLNINSYLGYADWRLPNVNELSSLINAEQSDSSAWLIAQGFVNVQGNPYWTSTTDPTLTSNAWLIFMVGGDKDSTARTSTGGGGFKVWPVRSGY